MAAPSDQRRRGKQTRSGNGKRWKGDQGANAYGLKLHRDMQTSSHQQE